MFLQQVGYLERFEHVGGVAVGAQADAHAAAHHLEHRSAAHGIAHIGFGVVHHIGLAVAQQIDFAVVDMDTVRGDGPAAEDAVIAPALHDALAVLALALGHVGRRLRDMHMKAGVEIRGRFAAARQRFVAQGKGGVQAEEAAQQAVCRIACSLEETRGSPQYPASATSAPSRSETS